MRKFPGARLAPLRADTLSENEMRAWQAFMHAQHDVIETLDRELRDAHGLTLGEYDVLIRLARAPDLSLRMSDLADRVLLSPSGLTRLVDRLERRGLVARQADTGDGRVALARLTPDGRRTATLAARTHLRGIREHFTGRLSQPKLRAVASALETISGPHVPH
jgi:DNA-binding MarR family transcriptional regulator